VRAEVAQVQPEGL